MEAATTQTWLKDADLDADRFRELVGRRTQAADAPTAGRIERNVPIYDGDQLRDIAREPAARRMLLVELADVLRVGPGVFAVEGALDQKRQRLDDATEMFQRLIAEQHAAGNAVGDHFARPGSNDRIWNSHEKLAAAAADIFAAYYTADAIALGCEAWLGPHYQITAQVNRVNPGGQSQSPHRDYHLGFFEPDHMARFPRHVHRMSPMLTLQGAVAHTDMPIESGPTMLLPFSQQWDAGFITALRDEFRQVFEDCHVQLPLRAGDLVFFSPALMHGAGENRTTDFQRIANLLQVSSPFGRTMEALNTDLTTMAVYPHLSGLEDQRAIENVIAAAAEGYAFPTNLDSDPPIDGLAPVSQADLLRFAVEGGWEPQQLAESLAERRSRRGLLDG